MKRLSYSIVLISILIGALLSACGPERLAPEQPGPSAQSGAAATQAPIALSPLVTPSGIVTPTIEIVAGKTPVPTPDLAASTQTELDQVRVTDGTPLELPETLGQAPLGLITWAPDGKRFLASAFSDESIQVGQVGYSIPDSYLGDAVTRQVIFLAHNAGWPAWSRDGQSIYYLASRENDAGVRYDLVKRSATDEAGQLILEDVGDPGTQPAVSELADGRLVLLNRDYQTAVLEQGQLVAVAELVDLPAPAVAGDAFSLAPDGTTLAIAGPDRPITLVDLAGESLIATIDAEVPASSNLAWSADSNRLAYGTTGGVFVYDRVTGSQQVIADRATFGFSDDDLMAGFHAPVWSPDQRLLLFAATSQDWMRPGRFGVDTAFEFAALADGTQLKPITDTAIAVAPDGARAIEFRETPDTGRISPALVDISWP
jgi:Tol biopolymer transport system component